MIPVLPGAVPEIPVSDITAATTYYRDNLSFSVDWVEAEIALAPLYASYTAVECHAAYARANTHADTARLDLHPYAVPNGTGRHVCGEVRAPDVESAAAISALRQRKEE